MKSRIIKAENMVNQSLCKECKGKNCCQISGCALAPKDFDEPITEEVLERRLKDDIVFSLIPTKKETEYKMQIMGISYNALFVPRIKGIKDKNRFLLTKKVQNNPCMYWNLENGCNFSDKDRPFGGINVVPNKDKVNCYNLYELTTQHKNDWEPYQEVIINLLKKLNVL